MRAFGKYRLVEPLASGGMADVWRARFTGAEGVVKEVALKLVRGEHGARSDFVRMFVEEARLASRLSHANVVQVFDFDQVDGRYYIAMELVRGHHLGRVLERAREVGVRVGLARAVHVVAEVAKGLAYAHRLADAGRPVGLVHRDVSPHNVLVSFEGEVKLADFGIARAMNLSGLTEPGTVKGKIAYMAPEQARGEVVDARADVFSLGVVLWELCAGRRLFARDTDAAALGAVLGNEPISAPSAWNEEVPPELDAIVLAALERDPARRTRSAQDLSAALAGVVFRLARSPDDVDLRAFMQRLWPEEPAADAEAPEPTRVRPVPLAREPDAAPPRGEPGGGAGAEPGETSGASAAVTRTALAPSAAPGRARRRVVAAVLGVLVAAGGAAAFAIRQGAAPTSSPSTTTPPPTATPTSAQATTTNATGAQPGVPDPSPPRSGGEGQGEGQAPTPPAAAAPTPASRPAPQRPPSRSVTVTRGKFKIAPPPASSGLGLLGVEATPWGTLVVDGEALCETPCAVSIPAGRHRVRVAHPTLRHAEREVTVEPGRRELWRPNLTR